MPGCACRPAGWREKLSADNRRTLSAGKDRLHIIMSTRFRTWILIAGLSALFIAVGGLVGGTGGLVAFLAMALVFNFAMFWFSDRLALKMSRARPL